MIRARTAVFASVAMFTSLVLVAIAVSGAGAMGGWHGKSSYDDDIAAEKARQERLESDMAELEEQLEDTSAAVVEAGKRLLETQSKLGVAQTELDAANEAVDAALVQQGILADKLAAAELQDEAIGDQISTDEENIAALEDTLGALARAQYQGAGTMDTLSMVTGAQSSEDFVDTFAAERSAVQAQAGAIAQMDQIAAVNRTRASRQAAVRDYISDLKVEADELVEETLRLQSDAAAKKATLDALVAEQAKIQNDLEAQAAQERKRQADLEAQQQSARDSLKELVKKKLAEEEARKRAEEEAAKNNSGSTDSGGSSDSSTGGGSTSTTKHLTKGLLKWPTNYRVVTSNYGMRYHPVLHYWRLHAGTDFRTYCNTPVYAALSGTVERAQWWGGFGNHVLIDHGFFDGKNLMTSYNHLTTIKVSPGQHVTTGQLVGYSGTTGTSTACHLHLEAYVNGETVDPMTLMESP